MFGFAQSRQVRRRNKGDVIAPDPGDDHGFPADSRAAKPIEVPTGLFNSRDRLSARCPGRIVSDCTDSLCLQINPTAYGLPPAPVIVTAAESARPPGPVAITRQSPTVGPAV